MNNVGARKLRTPNDLENLILTVLTHSRNGEFLSRKFVTKIDRRCLTENAGVILNGLSSVESKNVLNHRVDLWIFLGWSCHCQSRGRRSLRGISNESPSLFST